MLRATTFAQVMFPADPVRDETEHQAGGAALREPQLQDAARHIEATRNAHVGRWLAATSDGVVLSRSSLRELVNDLRMLGLRELPVVTFVRPDARS